MPFRAFDAATAKLLEQVHDSLLRDVHSLYPHLPPKRWATTRTTVIEKLIHAGERGERDPNRIKRDILDQVRQQMERERSLDSHNGSIH